MIEIFKKHGLQIGRMVGYSKSEYRLAHPNHEIVFNANIILCTNDSLSGKVWHGDLDITLDTPKLKAIANELNTNLYILRELDCRFHNENDNISDLMIKAVHVIKCDYIYIFANKN